MRILRFPASSEPSLQAALSKSADPFNVEEAAPNA